jgi:hypothetical protein
MADLTPARIPLHIELRSWRFTIRSMLRYLRPSVRESLTVSKRFPAVLSQRPAMDTSSTSKINVAFGGIEGLPCEP